MQTRALLLVLFAAGCMVGPDDDETIDDGDDGTDAELIEAGAPDPTRINVGFNNGFATQFDYWDDFFGSGVTPPARLCHAYVSWRVALLPAGSGSVADHASPAFIEDWLRKAQGKCDEVLISFKSMTKGSPPATSTFADAFEKFVAIDWHARTGFTGNFAFTAWNEPNNGDDAGNGLGVEIPPRVAARYFLVAERACKQHGCKVAAGDFASNGNMWDDFRWNCANDNVAPSQLCHDKSSMNPDGRGASYLDIYKNELVNRAPELGLGTSFRPAYFAYHGWHDTNRYLNDGDHCSSYETCTLRRLLRSLRGSWGNVVIWNTEDGVGQTSAPDDREQACAAAFLLRLELVSPRVKRLYLTRLRGGPGTLFNVDHTRRPAATVFANRETSFAGSCR
ncbi:MAG TPA: hypothetical protein VL326_04740 [Kofleriaceae bacterium]|nr:hypothetical protein [Kofleriaceae bacterium]